MMSAGSNFLCGRPPPSPIRLRSSEPDQLPSMWSLIEAQGKLQYQHAVVARVKIRCYMCNRKAGRGRERNRYMYMYEGRERGRRREKRIERERKRKIEK